MVLSWYSDFKKQIISSAMEKLKLEAQLAEHVSLICHLVVFCFVNSVNTFMRKFYLHVHVLTLIVSFFIS
jgi:hypothetical protein